MTRTMVIVGLIAALVLTVGGPGFSVAPANAEKMDADMAMMKATGTDLMSLKQEINAIRAELERLAMRAGTMARMVDSATGNYCASVPEALLVSGFAPGLCK
ncbi:MAG: hypothetical protein HY278_00480 [candidate division NC10 bacterium]|nr:hypothetical protein [candidate division NC10 bacterium]